ncbi:hypothetical protein [Arenibaculum pallidiluteum]|uniref:hypothetical protein n=1 Tax=Arenibaculum pallidiluteum TaxID=2812559 RepID=UPI001A96D71F|nr:hypothetical protein [Arenibaculum pallidiluteum]
MRTILTAATALAAMLAAGAAAASPCGDRIAALETRLDNAAETSISASSSGKGVAAAREGQAMQAENGNAGTGEPTVPFQDRKQEKQSAEQAAAAGGGGDRILQAKATLNRARSFDQEGNASACQDALAELEGQLEGR